MPTLTTVAATIAAFLFFFFMLAFLRKGILPPRYVVSWIAFGAFLVTVPAFQQFYKALSFQTFGFQDATNFIFVCIFFFVLAYSFLLTIYLVRVSDCLQVLISKVAILENDLKAGQQYKQSAD